MPVRTLPLHPRAALAHLRSADPVMGRVIDAVGRFNLPVREPSLHLLCASVIGQSISLRAADSILARFDALLGGPESLDPHRLLAVGQEDLRALGLTAGKARALHGLAELWERERWSPARLAALDDAAVTGGLVAVKGIGPWTAKMFLIFGLRRPDVLPVEDLGLREGLRVMHGLRERPSIAEAGRLAACWSPWATVGTVYAWNLLMKQANGSLAGESGWWRDPSR